MPAWPGGECPECGEYMPENIIHCQKCRTLLNTDLDHDSVEIPAFQPLPELDSLVELQPAGYYLECPHCTRELRVRSKYLGARVQCRYCQAAIRLDSTSSDTRLHAFFATCPYCDKELRARYKYLGMQVACKFCGGRIHFVSEGGES